MSLTHRYVFLFLPLPPILSKSQWGGEGKNRQMRINKTKKKKKKINPNSRHCRATQTVCSAGEPVPCLPSSQHLLLLAVLGLPRCGAVAPVSSPASPGTFSSRVSVSVSPSRIGLRAHLTPS